MSGIGLNLGIGIASGARSPFGPELLTNPDFNSATGWLKDVGWTISGGQAVLSEPSGSGFSNLYQLPNLVSGQLYRVFVTVLAAPTAGRVAVRFGGTYGADITTTGALTFDFTAATTGANVVGLQHRFGGSAGTVTCTVDSLSCRQVL